MTLAASDALSSGAVRAGDTSVTIPSHPEETALAPSRRTPIAVLALVALLFAQSAVCLHLLKHFAAGDDGAGQPTTEARLCLDCVSFAPLLSAHGGSAPAFVMPPLAVDVFAELRDDTIAGRRHNSPFRSRAPPR